MNNIHSSLDSICSLQQTKSLRKKKTHSQLNLLNISILVTEIMSRMQNQNFEDFEL